MSLREKRDDLQARLQDDNDKLIALLDQSEMTEEDEAKAERLEASVKELEGEIEGLTAQIKRQDEAAARRAKLDAFDRRERKPAASPPEPATPKKPDPSCGFSTPREFITAVMEGTRRPQAMDDRLRPLKAAAGSDEHGTYDDAYGGFLVPEAFSTQILSTPTEADPTAGRTRNIPMTATKVSFAARVDKDHSDSVSGGLQVYRRAETDTVNSSRTKHERVSLEANSLFGVAYETEELMTDSPVSFAALIAAGFDDEFKSRIFSEKLNGTGAGEYEGILKSDALITVAKESGQTADTIVYENIIKMRARCWGYSNAIWIANHDTLPQLMQMNASFGTGGNFIWQSSARDGEPDRLLGRPIYFSEYAETIGDKGDLILANWSQFLEGELQGVRNAQSMHVRFLEHERTFKFYTRNDGRSWWKSALTPKKGSTLSPFVTLAARA